MIDFKQYFYYDESSPSKLRWKLDRYRGRGKKVIFIRKGDVAGIFHQNYWRVLVTESSKRKGVLVHRVVWEIFNGEIEDDSVIDHINRDPSDNRIENLRKISKAENNRNAWLRSTNKTGISGVALRKYKGNPQGYLAQWYDIEGKSKSKWFSIKTYGEEEAFKLAKAYRESKILEINLLGAGYTEDHGKRKE